MAELPVIATVSNPLGYRSRYRLYEEFRKRMTDDGANVYTVELVFPGQNFAVTESGNSRHVQLRTDSLIWHKENLVNIALKRLPPGWDYAAWVDADIAFLRPDWIAVTLDALERHAFVQMFTHVVDLGPNYESLKTYEGVAYRYLRERAAGAPISFPLGQPGYAWAARREALEAVGGLIDWSILGSNDHYMALGLAGKIDPSATGMPNSNYANMLMEWQERCQQYSGCSIGYIGNALAHYWHGRRADRGYGTRRQILVDHAFDPTTDLRRDTQGLLHLTDVKPDLRKAIQDYFANRKEDEVAV